MGISIGGGIGPLRVSASTGRLRMGKKEQEGLGVLLGLIIVLASIYFVAAWPWLLGTWLAVELGAAADSTTRAATGWALEGLYVLGLIWAWLVVRRRRTAADAAAQQWRLDALELQRRQAMAVVDTFRVRHQAGRFAKPMPSDLRPRRGEVLVERFEDIALLEPRVLHRGHPPQPAETDSGELLVTSARLLFIGGTRTCEWDLSKFTSVQGEGWETLVSVSNRQAIKGFEARTRSAHVGARIALEWATTELEGVDTFPDFLNKLHNLLAS